MLPFVDFYVRIEKGYRIGVIELRRVEYRLCDDNYPSWREEIIVVNRFECDDTQWQLR